MGRFDRLYARLPLQAQHAAVSIYGYYWHWLRFGPGYSRYVQEYTEREFYDSETWSRWQHQQLSRLLQMAESRVPFYRDNWTTEQRSAAHEGRLEALPFLEKAPLRANPHAFLQDGRRPSPGLTFHTSGSSGTPIATMWTRQELRDSLAVRQVRSAGWAGVSFTMPRATFSGRMVEPDPNSSGPFYRFNRAEQQVYLSAFHLRPETAKQYLDALARHGVQWLTGYAVSYYLLAKHILEQGLDVPPLQAIITTSEKVTPEMRRVMEHAFGCRVYEEYSTVENALFASECEHGKLHVSPDVAVVEIVRPDGSACEPGEIGEIVTTCLMRTLQPMIRYRIGDLAMWDQEGCRCGRAMPVIKEVVGRLEDVVVGPDGREMVRFHGIFVDQPHVEEGQIIQETTHRIHVKVVTTEGFGQEDIQDITRRIHQRIGPAVEVVIEAVNKIPRTKAGKFKAVISHVRKE